MDQVLQDFIAALRSSGVRVSVSETLDAMHAARLVGYESREVFRTALCSALAKSRNEQEIFHQCFDRYFSADGFSRLQGSLSASDPQGAHALLSGLARMVLSGDGAGLSMSMRAAARNADLSGIRFFTQKSLYVRRILDEMGVEHLDRDIRALSALEDPASLDSAAALEAHRRVLYDHVRDFVEQQYALHAARASEELMESYLKSVKLSNLEQRDFARMHAVIQKMVKRLNDRHWRRRRAAKRGWLDFKKTLRANVAFQGPLFDTRWKTKKRERPDVLALCDVSRSVQTVVRFMLLFLYGLNEAIVKIRTFIFCSNLVEVTRTFEEYAVEEALDRLQNGTGIDIRLGLTDYGQAFEDFECGYMDLVTRKTTVLILGDARNNYGDPRTDVLRAIHRRSKRVLWLNPESPAFWGTGDSEMRRYVPHCHRAVECSTVRHLERVVDSLLTSGGRR